MCDLSSPVPLNMSPECGCKPHDRINPTVPKTYWNLLMFCYIVPAVAAKIVHGWQPWPTAGLACRPEMACTLDLDRSPVANKSPLSTGRLVDWSTAAIYLPLATSLRKLVDSGNFFCRCRPVDHGCVDSKFTRAPLWKIRPKVV